MFAVVYNQGYANLYFFVSTMAEALLRSKTTKGFVGIRKFSSGE